MTQYTIDYSIRYGIASVQQQIEVAVVTAAQAILNEDSTTPDHANRLAWANWASLNSVVAWLWFAWAVALNPAIQESVGTDLTGENVKDSDIQFVVNSNVENVITQWIANPPGVRT